MNEILRCTQKDLQNLWKYCEEMHLSNFRYKKGYFVAVYSLSKGNWTILKGNVEKDNFEECRRYVSGMLCREQRAAGRRREQQGECGEHRGECGEHQGEGAG